MELLLPSILLSEDEPAAFDICSLRAASASSDYKGQIDFFPWRFYHQRRNADFVAVPTQSMPPLSPLGTLAACLNNWQS